MADVDAFATATSLLSALRTGGVSATELTELYIRRIERHDGRLNAVVVRDFDRARQQARAADQSRARNESAPLLGLPITLKESINVTGLGTTCGVPDWKGYVSPHDGPIAARTRAAGAVLLGKTNVPPMLADWQSANPIFGRTNNPWDLTRTPGGSSGGSAAAIAAGLSALEVGSDIGGSIRVPAVFCGTYGHRPGASASATSGWRCCRRSRGIRWTSRSPRHFKIWPAVSRRWARWSRRSSRTASAITASTTASTARCCPR